MGYSHRDHNIRVPQNMQQRHFEFVASIIREQVASCIAPTSRDNMGLAVLHSTAKEFASGFRRSNDLFNRDRFMVACGFTRANGYTEYEG